MFDIGACSIVVAVSSAVAAASIIVVVQSAGGGDAASAACIALYRCSARMHSFKASRDELISFPSRTSCALRFFDSDDEDGDNEEVGVGEDAYSAPARSTNTIVPPAQHCGTDKRAPDKDEDDAAADDEEDEDDDDDACF